MATVATETAAMRYTSFRLTPRTLPKRAASASVSAEPNSWTMASPSANDAVVTTPIAASDPTGRRRVIHPMSSAVASPHAPAARNTLIPINDANANPPKIEWDRPCPM